MTEIEMICFKMISALGAARSAYMEALAAVKHYQFEAAQDLLEQGKAQRLAAHDVHFNLLQIDSANELERIPLLLMHAEDQLLSVEVLEVMAEELMAVYRLFEQNQSRKEDTK